MLRGTEKGYPNQKSGVSVSRKFSEKMVINGVFTEQASLNLSVLIYKMKYFSKFFPTLNILKLKKKASKYSITQE